MCGFGGGGRPGPADGGGQRCRHALMPDAHASGIALGQPARPADAASSSSVRTKTRMTTVYTVQRRSRQAGAGDASPLGYRSQPRLDLFALTSQRKRMYRLERGIAMSSQQQQSQGVSDERVRRQARGRVRRAGQPGLPASRAFLVAGVVLGASPAVSCSPFAAYHAARVHAAADLACPSSEIRTVPPAGSYTWSFEGCGQVTRVHCMQSSYKIVCVSEPSIREHVAENSRGKYVRFDRHVTAGAQGNQTPSAVKGQRSSKP